jgi:hypothetical protein
MPRRLAFALLTAVFLVAAPATASAQAAPDERANARAFADIGLQLAADFKAAVEVLDVGLDAEPACLKERGLARRLRKAPASRMTELDEIRIVQSVGDFSRALEPAFAPALSGMHAIPTADPALRGGRTAWRRIRRVYASMAAVPAADICAEARTLVRNGFHRTPAMRRAHRAVYMADHTGGIGRRLERAVKRLEELGVPAADANLFDGPFSD